ncbi:MAG: hypothetical protein MJY59_01010 [Bacteroidaceae bacterium]|nr:hypothetical protein [Bacteroidaceae bacterium]
MRKYIKPTTITKIINLSSMIALSLGDDKATDEGEALDKSRMGIWGNSENESGSLWQ